MKRIHGIYQIRNIVNNKVYIGSAIDVKGRWDRHKSLLNRNKHHSKHLQFAWNKYGEDNFVFEIIEKVKDSNKLIEREQYWLDKTQSYKDYNGYNISIMAGSQLGFKHTEKSIKKMCLNHKGQISWSKGKTFEELYGLKKAKRMKNEIRRKTSKIAKNNPNFGMKGKYHNEKSKKRISISHTGKKLSEKHKKNLSIAHKGKKRPPFSKKWKINMSKSGKVKIFSKEHRNNLSKAGRGKNHPMYGKYHSEKTRKKMSESRKKYLNMNKGN